MVKIDWIDEDEQVSAPELPDLLNAVAQQVLKEEGIELDVSLTMTFVTEEEMQRINRDYRQVDSVTDVLSFPMIEGFLRDKRDRELIGSIDPENGCVFLGDLVLCPKRIREQAQDFGHGERREFGYMCAHGLLHLLGYDHETEDERAVMRQMEEKALMAVQLPRE